MNSGAPLMEDRVEAMQIDREYFAKANKLLTEEQRHRFIQIWRWGFVLNDDGLFPNLKNPTYHTDLGVSEDERTVFSSKLDNFHVQYTAVILRQRAESYKRFITHLAEEQRNNVALAMRGDYTPSADSPITSIEIFSYVVDETQSDKREEIAALKKTFLAKSHALQKERGISDYRKREKLEAELMLEYSPKLEEVLGEEEFRQIHTEFVRFHFDKWSQNVRTKKIYMFQPCAQKRVGN